MGREKDRIIEEDERGWRSGGRHLVCDQCVSNDAFSELFDERASEGKCHYCGQRTNEDEVRCIPFDEVMDRIGEKIYEEYDSADNEFVPYESAEGGYQTETFTTYELLIGEIGLEATDDSPILRIAYQTTHGAKRTMPH